MLAPVIALAEAEQQVENNPSRLASVLYSILPIIVVGCLIFFFLRKPLRKQSKRSDDYIANTVQHNQRVEQLLERIAVALEKRNGGDH